MREAPAGDNCPRKIPLSLACLAVTAAGVSLFAAPLPKSVADAVIALLMFLIAGIDWRHYIIPNEANLAAASLAVAGDFFSSEPLHAVLVSLARGVVVFVLFFGFRWAFRTLRGREGIGMGDVKLAAVGGLWLDERSILSAIEIACLTALTYVFARRFLSGRKVDAGDRLPFGAFFAPALWVAWLWAQFQG